MSRCTRARRRLASPLGVAPLAQHAATAYPEPPDFQAGVPSGASRAPSSDFLEGGSATGVADVSNFCSSASAIASASLRTGRSRYGLTSFVVTAPPVDGAPRLAPIPAGGVLWITRI